MASEDDGSVVFHDSPLGQYLSNVDKSEVSGVVHRRPSPPMHSKSEGESKKRNAARSSTLNFVFKLFSIVFKIRYYRAIEEHVGKSCGKSIAKQIQDIGAKKSIGSSFNLSFHQWNEFIYALIHFIICVLITQRVMFNFGPFLEMYELYGKQFQDVPRIVPTMVVVFAVYNFLVHFFLFIKLIQWNYKIRKVSKLISSINAEFAAWNGTVRKCVRTIQEAELFAQGYRVTIPLPPITRLELTSSGLRALDLRQSTHSAAAIISLMWTDVTTDVCDMFPSNSTDSFSSLVIPLFVTVEDNQNGQSLAEIKAAWFSAESGMRIWSWILGCCFGNFKMIEMDGIGTERLNQILMNVGNSGAKILDLFVRNDLSNVLSRISVSLLESNENLDSKLRTGHVHINQLAPQARPSDAAGSSSSLSPFAVGLHEIESVVEEFLAHIRNCSELVKKAEEEELQKTIVNQLIEQYAVSHIPLQKLNEFWGHTDSNLHKYLRQIDPTYMGPVQVVDEIEKAKEQPGGTDSQLNEVDEDFDYSYETVGQFVPRHMEQVVPPPVVEPTPISKPSSDGTPLPPPLPSGSLIDMGEERREFHQQARMKRIAVSKMKVRRKGLHPKSPRVAAGEKHVETPKKADGQADGRNAFVNELKSVLELKTRREPIKKTL